MEGKLVKIDRNGSKHYTGRIECDRCQGRGWYAIGTHNGQLVPSHVDNAVCYKCHGDGYVIGKWIERTPEYQAKLDARRQARQEAARQKYLEEHAEEIRQRELAAQAERERIEREKAEEAARKARSQYVGEVGEKVSFKGAFEGGFSFEAHIGWLKETRYIYKFRDTDGNLFTWFTSSGKYLDMQKGEPVEVTGTVKEHKEYQDEKQTCLTRAKVKAIA